MKSCFYMAASALLLLMAGCNAGGDRASESTLAQETTAVAPGTAIAPERSKVPDRQFIRSSDMKFRVKDVAQATYRIEELTRNFNGFVTYTQLESIADEKSIKAISADSALETLHYTVTNNMTLRVPNTKLDSTLHAIAGLVDYLDYRTIKADDVALQLKANEKTQARAINNNRSIRNAIDNRGKKLNETTAAENLATDRQKEADEAEIANLSLKDQISYSTISLSLYQRAETRRWIIPNQDNTDDYRPGFGLRIAEALKTGWHLVQDLAVVVTRLWLLLLIVLLGFLGYRKYRPRKAVAKS